MQAQEGSSSTRFINDSFAVSVPSQLFRGVVKLILSLLLCALGGLAFDTVAQGGDEESARDIAAIAGRATSPPTPPTPSAAPPTPT